MLGEVLGGSFLLRCAGHARASRELAQHGPARASENESAGVSGPRGTGSRYDARTRPSTRAATARVRVQVFTAELGCFMGLQDDGGGSPPAPPASIRADAARRPKRARPWVPA
ncbi:hypothetical protein ACN28S_33310 [Cystobacter fuscus]